MKAHYIFVTLILAGYAYGTDRQCTNSLRIPIWDAAQAALIDGLKENFGLFPQHVTVSYYLYTKENPNIGQKINPSNSSIQKTNFNPENPTFFIIHGWTASYTDDINVNIRKAWLSRGDYNLISVDWDSARWSTYLTSVASTLTVGKKVADMIDFLAQSFKMPLDTLTIVGHSLGAHVSGYAGKHLKSGKIGFIIGLDPAGPLFFYDFPKDRLASTDAKYVQVIHSNAGLLGFLEPIGTSDFYVYGGKSQPDCGLDIGGSCSHTRSIDYYVEAVQKNNFVSIKCKNYEEAIRKSCGGAHLWTHMGAVMPDSLVEGVFYVPVNEKSPYGMLWEQ